MEIILQLPSDLKIIPETTLDIIKQIKSKDISEDDLFDIRLALEEALVNAVKHGNKQSLEKKVFLKIIIHSSNATIEIKDEGKGFDCDSLASPVEDENLKKTCGRGIFLIKKLMDKVEFFDGGSGIRMVKSIEAAPFQANKRRKGA
ncbi:MAG: ATP-binding protein [Candidatus Omnitrophota bacterium]